jgi:hypothetical protein
VASAIVVARELHNQYLFLALLMCQRSSKRRTSVNHKGRLKWA